VDARTEPRRGAEIHARRKKIRPPDKFARGAEKCLRAHVAGANFYSNFRLRKDCALRWRKRFRKADVGEGDSPERASWGGFALLLLLLAGLGYVFSLPYRKEPPLVRSDFVGRIVDKSVTLRETDIGTLPIRRLLVETADGGRFQITVTGDFYGRAGVGMWVERSAGELKLSWDEPRKGPPRGGNGAGGR
jgi:hypothetical protein